MPAYNILEDPGYGKAGDKVQSRKDLFHKVEYRSESALPTSEGFIKDQGRDRRPDDIAEFSKNRDRKAGISCKVH